MCDATLHLGFHLCEIVGVFVWFDPWCQLFTKRRKLCMTTGCVCICCLLLVCFGDVKELVGVVVRVQQVTNTASSKPLCTDTSQFRGVRRSMPRSRWSSGFARWLASSYQRRVSQVRASVTDVCDSPAAVDSWASASALFTSDSHAPHHVPQRILTTADASVPPYLDTPIVEARDDRNFFFLWSGVGAVGDLSAAHEVEAEQEFAGLA